MSESFVSYRSFHEALKELPIEQYGKIMFAINEYALDGVEPDFSGVEKMVFLLIKPQLDANIKRQDNGKFGASGGRPKKNAQEENKNPMGFEKSENKNPMGFEKSENKNPMGFEKSENKNPMGFEKSENKNPNENENLNANENENENVNVNLNARGADTHTLTLSDQQKEMAEQIHAVFSRSGLPASPYPQFIQGEFMRGMRYIHQTLAEYRLSSSDIVRACENYASVVNDPGDYFTLKMPFDRLVAHPKFPDFLPASFVKENWRKWGSAPGKDAQGASGAERKGYADDKPCPKCKAKAVYWYYGIDRFKCGKCGASYEYAELHPLEEMEVRNG